MTWFVYILRCGNGSYYIGHCRDMDHRFLRHAAGSGARHTASHSPKEVLYRESFESEAEAVRRERQLKGWTRAKKAALIAGDKERLRALSVSRD